MTFQLTALSRIAIGLMQGIALYLLQQAFEAKTWPATDGLIFAPLLAVAIFVPTIVVAGLGNMRARTSPLGRLSPSPFAQAWQHTISFVTQRAARTSRSFVTQRAARPSSALPRLQTFGFA
jgi:hypothetical protein